MVTLQETGTVKKTFTSKKNDFYSTVCSIYLCIFNSPQSNLSQDQFFLWKEREWCRKPKEGYFQLCYLNAALLFILQKIKIHSSLLVNFLLRCSYPTMNTNSISITESFSIFPQFILLEILNTPWQLLLNHFPEVRQVRPTT